MHQEKHFYVYVHRKLTDGKVFYVGKGSKDRAFVSKGRNRHWKNIVNKHGYSVSIVMRFLKDACARSFEKALIKFYGFENLCNLTNGGEGWHGRITPIHVRDKISKSLIENGNHMGMIGKKHSDKSKNAIGSGNKGKSLGSLSGKFKPNLYNFIHKDGTEMTCTAYELNKITSGIGSSGHAYSVVLGTRKSVKGWSLVSEVIHE